jgi:cobalt-zinc-cadmium resistance protein CzcA
MGSLPRQPIPWLGSSPAELHLFRPAALSHAIRSDSQRPFAIVIVGGLMVNVARSIFILPMLYVWLARDGDRLPEPKPNFEP